MFYNEASKLLRYNYKIKIKQDDIEADITRKLIKL